MDGFDVWCRVDGDRHTHISQLLQSTTVKSTKTEAASALLVGEFQGTEKIL
jgi:hypothetical protein